MHTSNKKVKFIESEEGIEIARILEQMASDDTYNTESSYSANSELYPDNLIPFVDKHMNYLSSHPTTDPRHYMSNLRLMTRVK